MNWLKSKNWISEEKDKEFKLLRDTRKPKVIDKSEHQTGKTNIKRDEVRKALPSGKRISKSGNIYYENRKNRSDLTGSKI
jgi:hypothetical protein